MTDSHRSSFEIQQGIEMTRITVKFNVQELALLSSLAADQLFRKEFIDPKFPGYQSNPAELRLGKQLVERMRSLGHRALGTSPPGSIGETVHKRPQTTIVRGTRDAI